MSLFSDIGNNLGVSPGRVARLSQVSRNKYYVFQIGPKKRKIKSPIPSLKLLQKSIKSILEDRLKPHPAAIAYVRNRSVLDHVAPHLGQSNFLKTDVRNCFDHVTEAMVRNIFIEAGYSYGDAYMGAKICCDEGSIPQGAPSSPLLCNLVLRPVDRTLWSFANKTECHYSRYGDDIVISGDGISYHDIPFVCSVLDKYGFPPNQEKTYFAHKPKRNIITGISISSGKMTVPRTFRRETRAMVNSIKKLGIPNTLEEELESFDPFFIDRVMGRLNWWSFVDKTAEFPRKELRLLRKQLAAIVLSEKNDGIDLPKANRDG